MGDETVVKPGAAVVPRAVLGAEKDVPLGTGYPLDIVDAAGRVLLRCKAKVAAKQARRLGLRLVDVDRAALQALRGAIANLPAGDSLPGTKMPQRHLQALTFPGD
jgi:hypothetical protein